MKSKMSKPVTYKGVEYKSLSEAGRHFALSPSVVAHRLRAGYPLEIRKAHGIPHARRKEAKAKADGEAISETITAKRLEWI
jgi:hypothetical protein